MIFFVDLQLEFYVVARTYDQGKRTEFSSYETDLGISMWRKSCVVA